MRLLLANPVLVKIVLLSAIMVLVFIVAGVWIYSMRKRLLEQTSAAGERPAAQGDVAFSLAAYNGVIQKLKEQEGELQKLRQSERGRAATSEIATSHSISSKLPSARRRSGFVKRCGPFW